MIEVIKFGAEWCGPCRAYEPIIESAKTKYNIEGSNVIVKSVDIDEEPELASQYNIRNVPTTIFIKEGNVIEKKVGIIQSTQFNNIIESL